MTTCRANDSDYGLAHTKSFVTRRCSRQIVSFVMQLSQILLSINTSYGQSKRSFVPAKCCDL
jgi:hypothetical protein